MSTIPYTFHDKLVLRSPYFAFEVDQKENIIHELLHSSVFVEAIYLASPVLHNECIKLREGSIKTEKDIKKITVALIKYYQRMYSRCTPFGKFASCTLVNWSANETNIQYTESDIFRSTRLDMHFLCGLAQQLALMPAIKNRLRYFPNSSIYQVIDEVWYIEYKYINGKRNHRISAVSHSEYLEHILQYAKQGITVDEMVQLLIDKTKAPNEEIIPFIDNLIAEQILVNELEPAITGKEFLQQVLDVLHIINHDKNEEITSIIELLKNIDRKIKSIDAAGNNPVSIYKDLINDIGKLNLPFEESKLFQVDLFREPVVRDLNDKIQNVLLEAFSFLSGLYTQKNNVHLSTFIKKFQERYESKEMPLLTVLDIETGIGYGNLVGNDLPLLDDILLPSKNDAETSITWSDSMSWLLKKLEMACSKRLFEIEFTEADVKQFATSWNHLPPSVSVFFKLVGDGKVILESIGGSSAINLLGRFAHGNTGIRELAMDIAAREERANPDIIFAEIVHLPEDRTGNVLLHPVFRQYEIPFLAKSSLPLQNQIPLSDLYVSVKNGSVKLISKKLQKEIIPRLSNAHNYGYTSLPIYHFLCDLQTQGLRGHLSFQWGNIARQFSFLPRVVYKEIILFEATWQLQKKDFENILPGNNNSQFLTDFISKWKIPKYAVLVDGDNELLIDFESKLSIEAFVHTIKNRNAIVLKEYLPANHKIVKNENEGYYANEFIATLIKTEKTYSVISRKNMFQSPIQRSYSPGFEWVYFKLYCGIKSADNILSEIVYPVVTKLLNEEKIDKWFFVRYNDPEFHLRLRFHLTDKMFFGDVVKEVARKMAPLESQHIIWKSQLDTYQRELERYNSATMELSESLFFIDSMQKLLFLQQTAGDERENIRWLWGLKAVDELLCSFNFSLQQKYNLLKMLKESFAKEFNANKSLFQQINRKYSAYKPILQSVLNNQENKIMDGNLLDIFNNKGFSFKNIATQILLVLNNEKISLSIDDLMSSYIHMSLNRLFISSPREQELIVYDFLFQYYQAELKRKEIKDGIGNL